MHRGGPGMWALVLLERLEWFAIKGGNCGGTRALIVGRRRRPVPCAVAIKFLKPACRYLFRLHTPDVVFPRCEAFATLRFLDYFF